MGATLMDMELTHVDQITAWQLETDDILKIDGEYVKVTNVFSIDEGILITYENDFGEEDSVTFNDDERLDLFMYL